MACTKGDDEEDKYNNPPKTLTKATKKNCTMMMDATTDTTITMTSRTTATMTTKIPTSSIKLRS